MSLVVTFIIIAIASSAFVGYVLWPRQGRHKCDAECRAEER